jgi:hypothetical protein
MSSAVGERRRTAGFAGGVGAVAALRTGVDTKVLRERDLSDKDKDKGDRNEFGVIN